MRARLLVSCVVLSGTLLAGCEDRKGSATRDAGLTEPSPNASILPAPLANGSEALTGKPESNERRDAGRAPLDAGAEADPPEPHALREDHALSGEVPHEISGLTLTARLRWLDAAPPPRVPEQNADGMQRARDNTAFDVLIDLAGGRMRLAFASRTFTLPVGSELHARDDLYGLSLLWPNRSTYTVLAPGVLRSVLSQQRADVVPLVRARASTLSAGTLFASPTERVELSTPTGKLELEQARGQNPQPANTTWASGASLCRVLIELVGASASTVACRNDLVPLRADYTWPNGEHFLFEVARMTRRNDFNPVTLAVPPTGAEFRQSELPPPPPSALLSDNDLTELRLRPTARSERAEPSAPKSGLLLVNHSESLRYFRVDGVLVARLIPGAEQLLLGLRAGKYQVVARDFFGNEEALVKTVEVPARFTLGDESDKLH